MPHTIPPPVPHPPASPSPTRIAPNWFGSSYSAAFLHSGAQMNHSNVALQSEKREGGELIFTACRAADLINNGEQVGGEKKGNH